MAEKVNVRSATNYLRYCLRTDGSQLCALQSAKSAEISKYSCPCDGQVCGTLSNRKVDCQHELLVLEEGFLR